MKKSIFVLYLLLPLCIWAKSTGIQFEHGLSWQQVKEKARAENKYIFIDCYASWCGPCKAMSKDIFPLPEVGDFFNQHFINIKIQFDQTDKDSAEIKAWYADAQQMAKDYSVKAYPTFLFFNAAGEPIHRIVGASNSGAEWLTAASAALDTTKQYYALIRKFEQGNMDTGFLKKTAMAALEATDNVNARLIADAYIGTQDNMFTKENIDFIMPFVRSSKSKGFALFLNNPDKIDAILGQGAANEKLMQVIATEEIYSKVKDGDPAPQWGVFKTTMLQKYPQKKVQIERAITEAKLSYYHDFGDWKNYAAAAMEYIKNYNATTDTTQANEIAGSLLNTCSNIVYLGRVLAWGKQYFEGSSNAVYVNTYANLLYKAGKKKDAIFYEKKALALAGQYDKYNYEQTLMKIKKGEKTW